MPEFTLFQAILHTGSETAEQIQTKTPELSESEVENWAKVYSLMDGQVALVIPSFLTKNEYILIGLRDRERNREVHYLIEQDPEIGAISTSEKNLIGIITMASMCQMATFV